MNILLDDNARLFYKESVDDLFKLCPEMMARKIQEANVQQGFVFDMVKKLSFEGAKILCIGSFEDTACEALKILGYDVTAIDPQVNMSLNTFFNNSYKEFDIIFSTSVLEHVKNDEEFIEQICQLLKPNGYGILTCDFKNDWKEGDDKPGEDERLYTKYDLTVRLNKVINDNRCRLFSEVNYEGEPDFVYGVHKYSFSTLTFKKDK